MNYSEVFRAMCNQVIQKETKKRGLDLKAHEPEITFENCNTIEVSQLDIFNNQAMQDKNLVGIKKEA